MSPPGATRGAGTGMAMVLPWPLWGAAAVPGGFPVCWPGAGDPDETQHLPGQGRGGFVVLWPHRGHLPKLGVLSAGATGMLFLPPCPAQTSRIFGTTKFLCYLEGLCFFLRFPLLPFAS